MVGPRLRQPAREARIGMPSACKADHPHACGAPGLNTVHTVFDDETALRRGREPPLCRKRRPSICLARPQYSFSSVTPVS